MRNSIIIRLENTLFNTSNISSHLPAAKDRERYLAAALPKCRINPAFVEPLALLGPLWSIGKPVSVSIVTGFLGEVLWKLLSANGLAGARIFQSAERAIGEAGGNSVLISTDPGNLKAAEMAGVPASVDISSQEAVLGALGVRKAASGAEHRAA